ncbi:ABC transporter ATP-binding protein [Cytobacillus firmus]|uniref:ABC transporter ATP-binding protein n=1 Tax=Cytobacillus firmus TaxID=1399 RepID=A0AA46PUJ2_CYTFI|nr:ABC transporter ATP-binding protein [Cytobacillus firmus]UYG98085.1 ABC transporter ATP-binding protein [Cytobacillus firmus]
MIFILELKNLEFSIDERKVLKSINFTWKKGETIAFMGGNGAGKSSLLKIISLLSQPSNGKLLLEEGVSNNTWKNNLGVVFSDSFLYDSLTAVENLQFYQQLYGKDDIDFIGHILEKVQLSSVKDEFVSSYSKGMRQRLSIARALIHRPRVLLLDEPFDGLDLKSKVIIEDILREHESQGKGYILVSHDVKQAFDLCKRVILLHDGEVIADKMCFQTSVLSFSNKYQSLLERNENEFL